MIRIIFRTLGLSGLVKCLLMIPFYETAYRKYEKKQRQVAERLGMSFEEYRESLIVYYGDDGKPLTDRSAIEARRKRHEAESRAYGLEELKQKYGYKDF